MLQRSMQKHMRDAAPETQNVVSGSYGSIDLATSGTDFRLIPLHRLARYGGSRSTERRSHTSRHQAARVVTDMEHGVGWGRQSK